MTGFPTVDFFSIIRRWFSDDNIGWTFNRVQTRTINGRSELGCIARVSANFTDSWTWLDGGSNYAYFYGICGDDQQTGLTKIITNGNATVLITNNTSVNRGDYIKINNVDRRGISNGTSLPNENEMIGVALTSCSSGTNNYVTIRVKNF